MGKKNEAIYPKHLSVEQRGPYVPCAKPDVWYYDTGRKLEFCLQAGNYTYLFEVSLPRRQKGDRRAMD